MIAGLGEGYTAVSAKLRRWIDVPGIIYSPLEGRARIQGTGIEVWLVAMTHETANGKMTSCCSHVDS